MLKPLSGAWLFKSTTENEWQGTTVPSCNYLDLLRLNEIPDPFVGTNEKDVYWVALKDWEYKRTFDVTQAELSFEKINLVCDMLDTICDVYINDKLIGKGENAHLQYSLDCKTALLEGENTLRIVFYSPVKFVEKKQAIEKCPKNWNGLDGIPHIRKPQCHFGWDWGPVLPPSGITRAIALEFLNTAKIKDLAIKQTHAEGSVTLDIKAKIDNFAYADAAFDTVDCVTFAPVDYEIELTPPNGQTTEITGTCGSALNESITIENPELWWTNDLSDKKEQPLYTVSLIISKDGERVDIAEKVIGLRTIVLNREKDQYGSNFQFILNGVPLFIKGANFRRMAAE